MKTNKKTRITERDYILANRKASREEEIAAHGKQISFRSHLHSSKKVYNRKKHNKAIIVDDDGLIYCKSGIVTISFPAL